MRDILFSVITAGTGFGRCMWLVQRLAADEKATVAAGRGHFLGVAGGMALTAVLVGLCSCVPLA